MRPFNALGWLYFTAGIILLACGLFAVGVAFVSLRQGEIEVPSRNRHLVVSRHEKPELFWGSFALWGGLGGLVTFSGYRIISVVIRDAPKA